MKIFRKIEFWDNKILEFWQFFVEFLKSLSFDVIEFWPKLQKNKPDKQWSCWSEMKVIINLAYVDKRQTPRELHGRTVDPTPPCNVLGVCTRPLFALL